MNLYFPKQGSHIGKYVKAELDPSIYGTKSDVKNKRCWYIINCQKTGHVA